MPSRRLRDRPLARQVLVLQALTVLALVLTGIGLASYDARRDSRSRAEQRALGVAQTIADSPTVRSALADADEVDPTEVLQPWAEDVRRDTDTDFVVVMAPDRTRYTHPDPAQIGRPFVGDLGGAPRGRDFTQTYTGTLGPSVRSVVPVRSEDDGEVIALVSVGITVDDIDRGLRRDVLVIVLCGAVALLLGLGAAWLLGRRLHRLTHGLGEAELARMYEYYSAVLHSVREGLLLLDGEGRVQLVNDEAVRLLDLPDDVRGRAVEDLGIAPGLVEAIRGGGVESDDLYLAGERIVLVSSAPATWAGREVGSVVTLRDHTELRAVTGELESVRRLSDSLRAQNHESANRLHTVVSLIEMGRSEEAADFATDELRLAQLLADRVVDAVADPVVAALLLGKSAEAAERGVELTVEGDLTDTSGVAARDLVSVLGNLIDNALDALESVAPVESVESGSTASRRRIGVRLAVLDGALEVVVNDSGPGLDPQAAEHALERGWTTKASPGSGRGLGLALVVQIVRRYAGEVQVGRSDLGGARFHVVLRPGEVGA